MGTSERSIRRVLLFRHMRSDIDNVRKMVGLLGDEGFVDAISNAETLVRDAEATLERVETLEEDAGEAVEEANVALRQVDNRLQKFDETISLIEAKIEAGFSVGFFFFAVTRWMAGDILIALALAGMGLLGAGSLVVTIVTLPQVQKLLDIGDYATDQVGLFDEIEEERRERRRKRREKRGGHASVGGKKGADGTQRERQMETERDWYK